MTTEIYYTLDEAAKILKLHPQTLRRWIRNGKLSAKRFGKQFRVRPEDIQQAARPVVPEETEEVSDFDRLALASLAELWDNDEDAIYDNWQQIYGVQ